MDNERQHLEFDSETQSFFLSHLPQTISNFSGVDFNDSMRWSQVQSKLWALEKILKVFGSNINLIYILGGWHGLLASLAFESKMFRNVKIRSFDLDPQNTKIAESLNQKWLINNWKFKATTLDVNYLSYNPSIYTTLKSNGESVVLEENPDLIINTSCEHFAKNDPWLNNIEDGAKVLFQSNNQAEVPDHKNCMKSVSEFRELLGLSKVLFEGEMDMLNFKRFMVLGYK